MKKYLLVISLLLISTANYANSRIRIEFKDGKVIDYTAKNFYTNFNKHDNWFVLYEHKNIMLPFYENAKWEIDRYRAIAIFNIGIPNDNYVCVSDWNLISDSEKKKVQEQDDKDRTHIKQTIPYLAISKKEFLRGERERIENRHNMNESLRKQDDYRTLLKQIQDLGKDCNYYELQSLCTHNKWVMYEYGISFCSDSIRSIQTIN